MSLARVVIMSRYREWNNVTLAARMLYFGEKTRYSGLSIRLLISLIFFWLFLSNTLMEYTARSDLVRS